MASDNWQLEIVGKQKQTLAGWGISGARLTTGSMQAGEFTFNLPTVNAITANVADFGDSAILYDHLGNVRFQGKRVAMVGKLSGSAEAQSYRFVDAWWDLSKRKYHQHWTVWTGGPSVGWTSTPLYLPHVILNYLTLLEREIQNVIDYANSQGVAIQAGTIVCRIDPANAATAVYAPTDEVTCRDCASVIKQLCGFAPLNVCHIDYATTPPTFHCVPASSLSSVAVPLTALEDLDIEARNEDVSSNVVIRYERTDQVTVAGVTTERPVIVDDVYPPASTGREERAVSEVVNLAGFSRTIIQADLLTSPFPADFTAAAAISSFWKQKEFALHLDNPKIKQSTLAIVAGTFTREAAKSDENDSPTVDLTLPNYLIAGQIAPWMKDDNGVAYIWQKQVLSVSFTYAEHSETGATNQTDANKLRKASAHPHKVYLIATNAPAGLNTFSTTTKFEEGERPTAGLAQFLYNQLSVLGYQGTKRRIQVECDGSVGMGTKLNISGGLAAWQTMDANVQSVTEDIDHGETTVRFGVSGIFNLGLLITLDRAHRTRRRWTAASQQTTGELA